MDTKAKVKDVIVKLLKVRPEELKDGLSLEQSLGVDSTEMVEIVIALQKEFGVKVEEKEVAKQQSVEQIAQIIDAKKSDKGQKIWGGIDDGHSYPGEIE